MLLVLKIDGEKELLTVQLHRLKIIQIKHKYNPPFGYYFFVVSRGNV
jgi:hypothetical protein